MGGLCRSQQAFGESDTGEMPPSGKKHPTRSAAARRKIPVAYVIGQARRPIALRRHRLPINPERGAGVIPARYSSGCLIRSLRRGPSSNLTCRESAASRALERPIQLTSFSSVQYGADRNEGL